ncbi:MAG: glycosyltransferase family 39 protein [Chloroflexota bacterium]|nr:MAG: glycosyltransferase family 39 protein [Chloroflexota bacterium]
MTLTPFTSQADKRRLLLLGVLLAVYLIGRLLFLMQLPPFIDEGLHSYYVEVMESGIISAGAGDGKWLSILIFYALTRLPADVLLLIRLASVASGVASLVAIFLIGRELFNTAVGLLSVTFYVFLPFALIYNRLGLADGIVAAFGAWTLLISIRTVRSQNGLYPVLLTALLLASVLAKASAIVFILFPVLALLLLTPREQWASISRRILPPVVGATFIVILMISQDVGTAEIVHKTLDSRPAGIVESIAGNVSTAARWFWTLLTPALAILAVLAILLFATWRLERRVAFLLVILAVVLFPYVISAVVWYPRYLLFALVPLALLLGRFWYWLTETILTLTTSRRLGMTFSLLLLALLLIWPAISSLRFVISPPQAQLPAIVRRQYISAWTAGYGVEELTAFLEEQARDTPGDLLILRPYYLSQVNHGGLDLFLGDDEGFHFKTIGQNLDQDLQEAAARLAAGQRTIFVFDSTHDESRNLSSMLRQQATVNHIWSHTKPYSTGGLEVWELSLTD